MTEKISDDIQSMFKGIYESIDLKHLRPLKRQMFKCTYDCLDDKNSVRQADKCMDECGRDMQKAMAFVQDEVNSFQSRIDRCLMDCQDSVRKEKEEIRARQLFEGCADQCVKKNATLVPEVILTLAKGLDKIKSESKNV